MIDFILGRLSVRSTEVRTRDRLLVLFYIEFSFFINSFLTVGYGWSCEIIGFIIERLTGKTIEAYWYCYYVLSCQVFSEIPMQS